MGIKRSIAKTDRIAGRLQKLARDLDLQIAQVFRMDTLPANLYEDSEGACDGELASGF
jgi:hypothetical protein